MFICHIALQGCLALGDVPYGVTADTGGHIKYLLELAQANPERLGDREMLETYHKRRHWEVMARVTGIDVLNRASMVSAPVLRDARMQALNALYGLAPVRKTLMQLGLGARG